MNTVTALRINAAACNLFLVRAGVLVPSDSIAPEVLRAEITLLRNSTIAQMQSAAEVIEAINAEAT
jgi:hypothetical protein